MNEKEKAIMFHSFGWPEALIILTIIIIVFGVGKLPRVGGAVGEGIREFRRGNAGLLETSEDDEVERNPSAETSRS